MKKNISILLLCFAFATVSGQAPYPFVKYSMVPSGIQTNDYHLKVFVDIWNGTSAASFSGAVKPVSVYASHVTYQLTWNTSTVNFGTVLISRDNFHTLGAGWEYHQVRVSEVPGLLQSGLICEFHPGFKIGANYCYNGGSINQYGNWVNHGINASGNPVALVPKDDPLVMIAYKRCVNVPGSTGGAAPLPPIPGGPIDVSNFPSYATVAGAPVYWGPWGGGVTTAPVQGWRPVWFYCPQGFQRYYCDPVPGWNNYCGFACPPANSCLMRVRNCITVVNPNCKVTVCKPNGTKLYTHYGGNSNTDGGATGNGSGGGNSNTDGGGLVITDTGGGTNGNTDGGALTADQQQFFAKNGNLLGNSVVDMVADAKAAYKSVTSSTVSTNSVPQPAALSTNVSAAQASSGAVSVLAPATAYQSASTGYSNTGTSAGKKTVATAETQQLARTSNALANLYANSAASQGVSQNPQYSNAWTPYSDGFVDPTRNYFYRGGQYWVNSGSQWVPMHEGSPSTNASANQYANQYDYRGYQSGTNDIRQGFGDRGYFTHSNGVLTNDPYQYGGTRSGVTDGYYGGQSQGYNYSSNTGVRDGGGAVFPGYSAGTTPGSNSGYDVRSGGWTPGGSLGQGTDTGGFTVRNSGGLGSGTPSGDSGAGAGAPIGRSGRGGN